MHCAPCTALERAARRHVFHAFVSASAYLAHVWWSARKRSRLGPATAGLPSQDSHPDPPSKPSERYKKLRTPSNRACDSQLAAVETTARTSACCMMARETHNERPGARAAGQIQQLIEWVICLTSAHLFIATAMLHAQLTSMHS